MKTLFLECNMGAAGDMLMAALYELVEDKEGFLAKMNGLLPEITVTRTEAEKCGIKGSHMEVLAAGEEEISQDVHEHHHHDEEEHEHHHDDEEHDHHHDDEEHGHHHHHHDDEEHGHHHHDDDEEHGHHHHHHDEEEHGHHHHHDEEEHGHHHHDEEAHGHHHHHVHRSMKDIEEMVASMELPETVRENVLQVYGQIAQAEAKAHGRPVSEVHFHEVGALDAVADITGVCLLLNELKPDRIVVSPINLGSGNVRCAHGILPVPAPATASILQGVPCYMSEIKGELCTPTGAALLRTFADEFRQMPTMSVEKIGYGMGKKDFPRANCVRAFWGEETETADAAPNQKICELAANLDDMTPEQLGFAMEKLLEMGARDVFYTPIFMKKSRPAVLLTCICLASDADRFAKEILSWTSTFGVRRRDCDRYALSVSFGEKETPWGKIRVKTGEGYGVTKSKYEYEDVAAIMRKTGKTWREVTEG